MSSSTGRVGARRRPRRGFAPYAFISPFFLVFGFFGLFPLGYTLWVSLNDWHLVNGRQEFVGLENFRELVADPDFSNALFNTLSIFVLSTVPQLLLALGIAWLLDTRLRVSTFWRSAVLVPNIVSVVAVGLVFAQLFGRDFGIVNWALDLVGLAGEEPIDWRAGTFTSHLALSVMVMWRWTGYNALIYLAAMQAVPRELYESAMLDGASKWRTFWSITVPSIRPTIVFTVIISTIGGLQLFTEPLLFGGINGYEGGSDGQFQTLTLLLYKHGFTSFDSGYAAAISWMLFLLIALIAAVNFFLTRRISSKG
ncbi:carbohydrate ABC transporter permease [Streptomyces sp. NBRC 109706]|uniref:carbohydrate ABC transporter permease n=1 Tax=Streptomyces sp. NBRC 109706 TaxID=1550035 RepID=UPI0007832E6C|nr:sugar ABC transporter permease [Streptomyces sp. NBRC 109706]